LQTDHRYIWGQDATFILIKLDNGDKNSVSDIRDPEVIELLIELQEELEDNELLLKALLLQD
jgi:hypothetical protein